MKHTILSIAMLLLAALPCVAKEYCVYTIYGKVTCGENNRTVRVKEYIDEDEFVTIHDGGCLILYDEKNNKGRRIALKEIGRQRIKVLVERADDNSMENFMSFGKKLISTLISGKTPTNTGRDMSSQGGSYRADDDNKVLLASVANYHRQYSSGNTPEVEYPITFTLKDSNGAVATRIDSNELYTIGVTNGSGEFLFVNALLSRPDGSKVLLLPIHTSNNCCAHLCIPPYSSVDFTQYARFISAPAGADIIVVASPIEVDFSILYRDFDTANADKSAEPTTKIGCIIQTYEAEE